MVIVENILKILLYIFLILFIIVAHRIRSILIKHGIEKSKYPKSLIDDMINLYKLNIEEKGKYSLFLNFSIFLYLFTILFSLIRFLL